MKPTGKAKISNGTSQTLMAKDSALLARLMILRNPDIKES
jgi:hypothetical protein